MLNTLLASIANLRCFVACRVEPKPDGGTNKIPIDPRSGLPINAQDSIHGMTLSEAEATGHRIGIVLHESLGLFALDLDNALQSDGTWSQLAIDLCGKFTGAYVEISQSGTGLHILGRHQPIANHRTRRDGLKLEVYTRARFILLTGTSGTGDVTSDHTSALKQLITDYLPEPVTQHATEWTTGPIAGWTGGTDEQIIASMRNRVGPHAIFGTGATFADLFDARAEVLEREYPSGSGKDWNGSAVDQALANHLGWATGYDCERTLRLMWLSKLTREKWSREDYLRRTILNAVAGKIPQQQGASSNALAIPKAQHRCTDQANAERLQQRFGNRLIACAGTFFAWDGKRWKADEALPQRFACELSKMVREEADAVQVQAVAAQGEVDTDAIRNHLRHPRLYPIGQTFDGARLFELEEIAKALAKWSKDCEMKAKQDAALGLLKKLLAVDVDQLDADPWLLNCENGTVDLRTGKLREQRAEDFITKLAPVLFDANAQAPRFRRFLGEIFASDAGLADFLARWFGYSATGSVREEKIVFHWGKGSNGKTTLIETIESVLGDYATTAPPGLLTAKNGDERHPAEIADLHGRRMVTASESEEGAKLREAFIKQTTGGDRLKGRRLYGQLYQFKPTHKLQLLTNHKPEIRGSDFAIWRRILLVPYTQKFGSAEQIASGDANRLGDSTLKESLKAELPGVLAWIVHGAREWYERGGLRPPGVVLAASNDYRTEQDRVGEFIRDSCSLDIVAWSPVSGLYNSYQSWCVEAGIHPLSRRRFMTEIERSVPGFRLAKQGGARGVVGIALVPHLFGPMYSPTTGGG